MGRQTIRALPLAVLAGLLAAGVGGCAPGGNGQQSVPRQGQVSYQGYAGTAIVSGDGRTVIVGLYPAGTCTATIIPVARENATRVALFLEHVPRASAPATPCPQDQAVVNAHSIRLASPLGHRKLVNGATDRAIAWITARLVLRPDVLRYGYRFSGLIPSGDDIPQSSGPAGCLQTYISRESQLVIGQSAGRLRVPGPGQGGWVPIKVRGQPGAAGRNVITWRENGLDDYIYVSTSPNTIQLLSTQQLIAMADSAPSYNLVPLPVPSR
jgi:hypothetical protein